MTSTLPALRLQASFKKVAWVAAAQARAIMVLPVPGGPCISTPGRWWRRQPGAFRDNHPPKWQLQWRVKPINQSSRWIQPVGISPDTREAHYMNHRFLESKNPCKTWWPQKIRFSDLDWWVTHPFVQVVQVANRSRWKPSLPTHPQAIPSNAAPLGGWIPMFSKRSLWVIGNTMAWPRSCRAACPCGAASSRIQRIFFIPRPPK